MASNSAKLTKLRLGQQLDDLHRRASYHVTIARDFTDNYYVSIGMSMVLSALSFALLFFISREGWDEPNEWQVAAFILSSAVAACFLALPSVFNQKSNIEQNKDLYVEHAALKNDIYTFLLTAPTGEPTVTGSSEERASDAAFIRSIDQKMKQMHKIPLGFKHRRVPTDYLASLPSDSRTGSDGDS